MTWLLSNAMMKDCANLHYSQAQEGESLADTCSDGEQFAQLNVMPTPHKFWRNDKMMEFSALSRFGLTLQLLTESHGEAVLMSYLEAFPVRIFPLQEKERDLMANEADCGENLGALFAKFDPDSSSWKTLQCSLLGDSILFSETWPRWGSMQNGVVYLREEWEPIMKETGYGLLPTPVATDARSENMSFSLVARRQAKSKSGVRLAEHLLRKMIPTPQAGSSHWNGTLQELGGSGNIYRGTEIGRLKISPRWTEQRMDFPTDWTSLKPLEMHKFQEWQQQHGAS
jgi:hypothetical protein